MQFSFRPRVARPLALAAGVLCAASFLTACNKGGDFVKSKSGFEYKIFRKVGGKYEFHELTSADTAGYKNRVGKYILGFISVRTGKDSVFSSSRKQVLNHPVPLPLQAIRQRGGQEEAWSLLQPGDSAEFRFNADSLVRGQPVPPFIKRGGNKVLMRVVVVKIVDQAGAMAAGQELQAVAQQVEEKHRAEQLKLDDVTIQDYLKKNNLTAAKKSPTGVYYMVTQPGTGPVPTPGQTVAVDYRGTLLSGKEFDSSAKQGKPIEFQVGLGKVIPGWDQTLLLFNKGTKATMVIPSSLAYGSQGAGADIPADSPLRFDIELKDIKAAPAPAPAMPGPGAMGAPGAMPPGTPAPR